MKILQNPKTSGVSEVELKKIQQQLVPEIQNIKNAVGSGYQTDYASVNLPSDRRIFSDVQKLIDEKKQKYDPKIIIVIGIGGSNLGTIAVHEAVNGLFYNEQNPETKIYFVDSVDSDNTKIIYEFAKKQLDENKNILINVVSKSGTTTETVVNFELFFDLLRNKRQETYNDLIVVTTDRGSKLWRLAIDEGFSCFEMPEKVGGRYSVFSPVGLFPLGFIGIDTKELVKGAGDMVDLCTQEKNPAALSAVLIFAQLQKGCSIHDSFFFSKQLRGVGDWYRQLVGESLGKEKNNTGQVVNTGITPTVSIGTNDLHSVTQLYLAGPYDKCTTFVTVKKGKQISVPVMPEFESFVANVQGISFDQLREAIVGGMYRAYEKQKRPFMQIELPELSSFYIGQFLQMKMIEVIYLGFLLQVNPFNQPQVELYKIGTREILATR